MMGGKRIWLLVLLLVASPAFGQTDTRPVTEEGNARDVNAANEAINGWWGEAVKTRDERLGWWRDGRFGCFIHWGVYAGPAGEWNGKATGAYSEHIMRQARIPLAVYKKEVVSVFDPEKFDANQWVSLFKAAGMKYVVITAKHHDGFAMWPSKVYPYNLADSTNFKRDPMRELSDACRAAGIHFGFYYSHAFDWEHPDAPGNDWDYNNPGGDKKLFGGDTWYDAHPELVDKTEKYVVGKAIPQLQELISMYHPDIFWFDVGGKLPFSQQLQIVEAVRKADANVVINGRAARAFGRNFGDYVDTSDNPAEVREAEGDWECIPTVNSSYGYNKMDTNFKTPAFMIRLLAKTAAKGGNMLMNIGPRADGTIDPAATGILEGIGKWMEVNGESIHGTVRTPLDRQAWGDSTVKGNTVYLHVFDWPVDGKLIVGGLKTDVAGAYFLSDSAQAALKTERVNENDLAVDVGATAPDPTDSVVVLNLAGPIEAAPGRLLETNVADNRLLAFDGRTEGGRFRYADGKAANYFVSGFDSPDAAMSWPARVNAEAEFEVSVVYSEGNDGATYVVKVGDQSLSGTVAATSGPKDMKTVVLGRVKVGAGDATVGLQAVKTDGELMNLFEVHLKPVKD